MPWSSELQTTWANVWLKKFWTTKELERLHRRVKKPQASFMSALIKWVDFTVDVGCFCGSAEKQCRQGIFKRPISLIICECNVWRTGLSLNWTISPYWLVKWYRSCNFMSMQIQPTSSLSFKSSCHTGSDNGACTFSEENVSNSTPPPFVAGASVSIVYLFYKQFKIRNWNLKEKSTPDNLYIQTA